MTIVALTGLKGSGKTTVAAALAKHHGFKRMAFADALKMEAAQALTMLDYEPNTYAQMEEAKRLLQRMHTPGEKEQFRGLMQWLGTEWRRANDADYWVRQLYDKLKLLAQDARVVIDDCRFENEAAMLRGFGARVYRVYREGVSGNDAHLSETEQQSLHVDEMLLNNEWDDGVSLAQFIMDDLREKECLA